MLIANEAAEDDGGVAVGSMLKVLAGLHAVKHRQGEAGRGDL